MVQRADDRTTGSEMTAREREAKRLRARAEELLRSACDLIEAPGGNREETGRLAYEYSVEALTLLTQAQNLPDDE